MSPVSSANYARLRSLLVTARHAVPLTQVELANSLGRPQSFVSKYETGERRLDVLELVQVLQAMDVDVLGLVNVTTTARALVGGLAGRGKIQLRVQLVEIEGGRVLCELAAEGKSSGGTVFSGTTSEAVDEAVAAIIAYLSGTGPPEHADR